MNAAKSPTPSGAPVSDIRALGQARGEYVPGTFINEKLELIALRGRGGMGEVWIARHHLLEIDVAVKVIRADRLSPSAETRLLREARSAARVCHPAIARVLDIGRTAEFEPYLVMELLQGQSLADLLDRERRLVPAHAVSLLLPVAHGLAAAHKKSIIHRDLKPENIFLSLGDDGRLQPKLLDFGIAFSASPERITGKHRVVATPEYASPEQVRGDQPPDERADIWAFCVVLYECITGERPFFGLTPEGALVTAPDYFRAISISDLELRAIVERGLCTDPNARWSSMAELGQALAHWLTRAGIQEDVTGTTLRMYWPNVGDSSAPQTSSVPPESAWPTRGAYDLSRFSEMATLESSASHRDSSPAREPTLIAPRPSARPVPIEPVRSSLPISDNPRLRHWGLNTCLRTRK